MQITKWKEARRGGGDACLNRRRAGGRWPWCYMKPFSAREENGDSFCL